MSENRVVNFTEAREQKLESSKTLEGSIFRHPGKATTAREAAKRKAANEGQGSGKNKS